MPGKIGLVLRHSTPRGVAFRSKDRATHVRKLCTDQAVIFDLGGKAQRHVRLARSQVDGVGLDDLLARLKVAAAESLSGDTGWLVTRQRQRDALEAAAGRLAFSDQWMDRPLELVAEVPFDTRPGEDSVQWSVLPQARIGISKRGHVAVNVGVEVPLNERDRYDWRAYVYLIWDFADGGFFEAW